MNFSELNLSKETMNAINDLGFTETMPIQEKAIPTIMNGEDVIGQAQTGTGKTAAFAIPLIEMIAKSGRIPFGHLIIAPTRELVTQIEQEFRKLGKYHNFRVTTIIGGVSYDMQFRELAKKPDIIVATPGRLIDHLKNKKIKLDNLKTFVVDEADEMFKKGFKEEMDEITTYLPENRQSLLFSATIDEQVQRLAKIILDHPKNISVSSGLMSTKNVEQFLVELKEGEKLKTLIQLLDINQPKRAIIFGRTKKRVDELIDALNKSGFKVRGIHGDMSQRERQSVINGYKTGSFRILVATDVAARGLDIKGVTHVYNFDLPQEVEFYVHRIGRTGRAGSEGVSISFARRSELPHIEKIKKESKSEITVLEKPTIQEHIDSQNSTLIEKFDQAIESGKIYSNKQLAREMMEKYDGYDLVLAAIELMKTTRKMPDIELSPEPPVRVKHAHNSSRRGKRNYHKKGNRDNRSRDNRNRDRNKDYKGGRKNDRRNDKKSK